MSRQKIRTVFLVPTAFLIAFGLTGCAGQGTKAAPGVDQGGNGSKSDGAHTATSVGGGDTSSGKGSGSGGSQHP